MGSKPQEGVGGGGLSVLTLPIDVVPGTSPPVFRWSQVVATPAGPRTSRMEGRLPANIEGAVLAMVQMVKDLLVQCDEFAAEVVRLSLNPPVVQPISQEKPQPQKTTQPQPVVQSLPQEKSQPGQGAPAAKSSTVDRPIHKPGANKERRV